MILSACNLVAAYAALAACALAAVGAHACALVNEVAAVVATRHLFFLFFFIHPIRLYHNLLAHACELSFRKQAS
jgi:hypothetical protein